MIIFRLNEDEASEIESIGKIKLKKKRTNSTFFVYDLSINI